MVYLCKSDAEIFPTFCPPAEPGHRFLAVADGVPALANVATGLSKNLNVIRCSARRTPVLGMRTKFTLIGGNSVTISAASVRTENEAAILADVRQRFEKTENIRLRQLMLGLIDHLHAFVCDNRVTWAEWEVFMAFLARGAAVTKDGRNEFIALSN